MTSLSKRPYGGRPKAEEAAASMEFSRQLLAEYRAGASYNALARKYQMGLGPVRARCQRARDAEANDG